jgi:hypothetical protein
LFFSFTVLQLKGYVIKSIFLATIYIFVLPFLSVSTVASGDPNARPVHYLFFWNYLVSLNICFSSHDPNTGIKIWYLNHVQWLSEYRSNPALEWSISAGTGHSSIGPFENQTNLSSFWMAKKSFENRTQILFEKWPFESSTFQFSNEHCIDSTFSCTVFLT